MLLTGQKTRSVTAAPATASAVAATPAAKAAASAASAATRAALRLGPGLADVQSTSSEVGAVRAGDRLFRFFAVGHFYECKSARLPAVAIANHVYAVHLPICLE